MDQKHDGITPIAYAARLRDRVPHLRLHLMEIPIISYNGFVPHGTASSSLTTVYHEGQFYVLRRGNREVARAISLRLLVDFDAQSWERGG